MIKIMSIFGTRPEEMYVSTLKLVGTNKDDIYKKVKILLTYKTLYDKMSKESNSYGD